MNTKLLDVALALHPTPELYCPTCYMRKENCVCQKGSGVAKHEAWALIPNGGTAKKPLLNVWAQRNACKKVKKNDTIQPGDRSWHVAFSVSKEVVDSLGGVDSDKFRVWKDRVMNSTSPMWHPVREEEIGKRPCDLFTASPIGRPREDWEYIEPK